MDNYIIIVLCYIKSITLFLTVFFTFYTCLDKNNKKNNINIISYMNLYRMRMLILFLKYLSTMVCLNN